ncbi:unnamed protein product, partial [Choristocarpus tenellus]
SFLREKLCLRDLMAHAFMFNFGESGVLGLGERKMCVQVEDSDWSKPFSMETIGVDQASSAAVRHGAKGTLEVGFNIVVPPGRLGHFTKIVQFWPRFLLVNRLDRALVLEQNSTLR